MDSIWTQTAALPRFAPLSGDRKTDVLIIGGGMAGLLCAYWLRQAGVDCCLVEANRICGGATKNTTAKITSQHGFIYDKLLREFGPRRARLYLETQQAALEDYRSLCRDMDCDFQERDAYVYSARDRRKLDRELEALARLGAEGELRTDLPFPAAGAIRFRRQAQFHPLKFAAAIAGDLPIFEDTKVLELGPGTAVTNRGTVTAEKMIAATHFPLLNKHGGYFLKLYQRRSYVLALENAPGIDGMYIGGEEGGLSFRDYGNLLLLGGGGGRTGKPCGGWEELEGFAAAHYPEARVTARWAAQDCMSLDGVPYAGRYSERTPELFVSSGFNKWGMTGSMAAARLLTDLVLGRDNPRVELFNPARRALWPQLAANAWSAAAGLLTPTVPRCPHMGCALKYNRQEHSWDCPCHGSRFQEDGRLIDNPATDDKQMRKSRFRPASSRRRG